MTPLYLAHFGTTFQGARLRSEHQDDLDARPLNLRLAASAGIAPGQRVLDAGCGVCGPAVDIARAIAEVTISGVTVSTVQAHAAAKVVREAGLKTRVSVCAADFHQLPYAPETFDVVLFLESLCYTYDLARLLRGVYDVLRPGGRVFVKDGFRREGIITVEEQHICERMCELYAVPRTMTVSELALALAFSGFVDVRVEPLAGEMSFAATYDAFFTQVDGAPVLNAFGALHDLPYDVLPVRWLQVRACRP